MNNIENEKVISVGITGHLTGNKEKIKKELDRAYENREVIDYGKYNNENISKIYANSIDGKDIYLLRYDENKDIGILMKTHKDFNKASALEFLKQYDNAGGLKNILKEDEKREKRIGKKLNDWMAEKRKWEKELNELKKSKKSIKR